MEPECPFCTTAKEEGRMLKEGQHAYVIFSNPRIMPGHLLVIPKRHIDGRLGSLADEERKEIFELLAEYQAKILDRLATGCDIRQNFKPYVKNSRTHVNHMHWHLYPRNFEDLYYHKVQTQTDPLYEDLPQEEAERLTRLLA